MARPERCCWTMGRTYIIAVIMIGIRASSSPT